MRVDGPLIEDTSNGGLRTKSGPHSFSHGNPLHIGTSTCGSRHYTSSHPKAAPHIGSGGLMRRDTDCNQLYRVRGSAMDMYLSSDTEGRTRRTNRWSCAQRDVSWLDKGTVCSVSDNGGGDMSIICRAEELWTAPPTLDFWGVLHRWQRTWVWDNLQWVGDDE